MYTKTIRTSEEQKILAEAFLDIGDAIILVDSDNNVKFCNEHALNYTGFENDQALNKNIADVFYIYSEFMTGNIIDLIEEAKIKMSRIGLKKETILKNKNGDSYYISASIASRRDKNGEYVGAVIVFRDITKIIELERTVIDERNNYLSIFDNTPAGIVLFDKNLVVLRVNEAITKLLDLQKSSIVGKVLGDGLQCINSFEKGCGKGTFCSECKLRKIINEGINEKFFAKEQILQMNFAIKSNPLGKWYKFNLSEINYQHDTQYMISITDVTERINHDIELKRASETSIRMLKNLPIMVWKTNLDMEIDYINNAFRNFIGTGENPTEAFKKLFTDEDYEKRNIKIKDSYEKKCSFSNELMLYGNENRIYNMVETGIPYYDSKQDFAGFIGTVADITEQLAAEKTIIQSKEKYRSLFINMEDSFIYAKQIKDENGFLINARIEEANETFLKLVKMPREDVVGKMLWDLFSADKLYLNSIITGNLNGSYNNRSFSNDEYFMKSLGKWCVTSVYSPEENGIAILISDIDEKKKMQFELIKAKNEAEAANKAKSEFLANMSHEIRTPLNGIQGMIDLTLMTEVNSEQKDYMMTAKTCAISLLNVINDILDFSKLEAGKFTIQNGLIDMRLVIDDVIKTNIVHINRKELQLINTMDKDIPEILLGDSNRLKQVLNNLISNAVKFTNNGEIEITTKIVSLYENKAVIGFSVRDTGIGISPEDSKKLFRSFSQIDGSYTRQYGGTGLGLIISKQIIEAMGGNITLQSEKGVGSTFSFSLEFAISNDKNKTYESTKSVKLEVENAKILIAEDDAVSCKVLYGMLEDKGFEVDAVSNGIDVIEYHKNNVYDIIFMDIQMPRLDGIETVKRIREAEGKTKHTPIVAVTAFALAGDKEKFLSAGMDYYISKPINTDSLYNTINQIMKNRVQDESLNVLIKNTVSKAYMPLVADGEMDENTKNRINIILKEVEKQMTLNDNIRTENKCHSLKEIIDQTAFDNLKVIAFKIEMAARRGDHNNLKIYIQKLKTELNNK